MKNIIFYLSILILCSNSFFAQDYWQKTNGPASETISALAINSSGHIFVGTYGKGIYISTDKGNSWQQTSLKTSWVNCLIINSNGTIFAGTDNGGIFRSTDNGSTWIQCNKNITWPWVYSFTINPQGHIYTGTYKAGLYYSTDNGDNWISVNTGLTNPTITSIIFNSNGDIFLGTDGHSIYRSKDNGLTWSNIGWSGAKTYCFVITQTNKIFAGTSDGIYVSTNNGDLWERIFDMNLMSTTIRSIIISNGNLFAAADGGDFWSSSSGVYISTNDGNKWTQLKSGLSDIPVYSLAVDNEGYIYAGAKNGFVYRSVNPTDLSETKTIPNSYQLLQNYPNPFNPTTTIEYSIPRKENVKINICDILGREIITLINQIQNAGTYKIKFIGNELSSGIYFYKMQAGNFSDTKKMLLIK